MCLITAVPKGKNKKAIDLESFIRHGMSTNTHGSGYAYKKEGSKRVFLSKGYTDADVLLESLASENLHESAELIIHHRIGTSGKRADFNMHPFLISQDENIIKKTRGLFEHAAMAHNGIMGEFEESGSDYNDTFLFVKNFIAIPEIFKFLKENPKQFSTRYKGVIGGEKLAFLFPDRDMILLGNFQEDNGYYHSNGGYKSYVYDRGGSSNHNTNRVSQNEDSYWQKKNKERERLRLLTAGTENDDDNDEKSIIKLVPASCGIGYTIGDDSDEIEDDDPGFPYAVGFERDNSRTQKPLVGSEDTTGLNSSIGNKKHLNGLKFTGLSLKITNKNFRHFVFVPVVNVATLNSDESSVCKRNYVYELSDYDETAHVNYIMEKYGEQVMHFIDLDASLKWFNVYVNHDYRDKYIDLQKFILANCNAETGLITATMYKKVSKALARVPLYTEYVKFKDHGWFFKDDLQHLCDQYIESLKKRSESRNSLDKFDYAAIADELIRNAVIPTVVKGKQDKIVDINWDEINPGNIIKDDHNEFVENYD